MATIDDKIVLREENRGLLKENAKRYEARLAHMSQQNDPYDPNVFFYSREGYKLLITEQLLEKREISMRNLYTVAEVLGGFVDEDTIKSCAEVVRRYAEEGGKGLVKVRKGY